MLLSALALSLLSLTPTILAAPAPTSDSSTADVEKRGFGGIGYGGFGNGFGGLGYGGGFAPIGFNRFAKERFNKNKLKALAAKERKNRVDFDRDTALAAKNYRELNFANENDRKFDNADVNKAKVAKLAKDKAANSLVANKVGGGGIWKRQFLGGFDGGLVGGGFDSGFIGGEFDSGFVGGGLVDGGLIGGGLDGGLVGGGLGFGGVGLGILGSEGSSLAASNEVLKKRQLDSDDLGMDDSSAPDSAYTQDAYSPESSSPALDSNSYDASTPDSSYDDAARPMYSLSADEIPSTDSSTPEDDSTPSEARNVDVQDPSQLVKRGFGGGGLGYGGGFGFGGFPISKFVAANRFEKAKLAKLAELENARRRKALAHNAVRLNTKNFNELKFKNNVHKHAANKAKAIAANDLKNIHALKKARVGTGIF